MRMMNPSQKWMVMQQEKTAQKKDAKSAESSPSYFARILLGEPAQQQQGQRQTSLSVTESKLPAVDAKQAEAKRVMVPLKDLQHLRVVLQGTAGKSWMQEFVREGGLQGLLALFSGEMCDAQACWRELLTRWSLRVIRSMVEGIVPEALRCLKAFMNNEVQCLAVLCVLRLTVCTAAQFGLTQIINAPAAIDQVAVVLTYGGDNERIQVHGLLLPLSLMQLTLLSVCMNRATLGDGAVDCVLLDQ